jgi:hypothetical protein
VESLPTGELRCIICSVKMNSRECANAHIMGTPAYSTISNLVRVLPVPVLVPRTTVLVLCTTGTVYYWYRVLLVLLVPRILLPYFFAVSHSIGTLCIKLFPCFFPLWNTHTAFDKNVYFSLAWKDLTNSLSVLFRTGISVFDIPVSKQLFFLWWTLLAPCIAGCGPVPNSSIISRLDPLGTWFCKLTAVL